MPWLNIDTTLMIQVCIHIVQVQCHITYYISLPLNQNLSLSGGCTAVPVIKRVMGPNLSPWGVHNVWSRGASTAANLSWDGYLTWGDPYICAVWNQRKWADSMLMIKGNLAFVWIPCLVYWIFWGIAIVVGGYHRLVVEWSSGIVPWGVGLVSGCTM